MFQKSLLAAALLVFVGCTQPKNSREISNNSKSTIINGTPVLETDVLTKSTAGLMMHYEYELNEKVWFQGCTASVLAKRFILTAAHCVKGSEAADLAVNFTINTFTSQQQMNRQTRITDIHNNPKFVVRNVKKFVTHPDYNGLGDNDLAVLMLDADIPDTAIPVSFLPDQYLKAGEFNTTLDGQKVQVTLVGFGIISESDQTETEIMRRTTLPARFETRFVVTDQTQGTGGCFGDSGGPAYFDIEGKTYLVGVTHGPHPGSSSCHEEGEWLNPSLFQKYLNDSMGQLASDETK